MNGYQKYKENSIYSMSGPELLLLLYEEAIRRLSKAEYALEDKEYGMFEDSLLRTSRIVRYLIYDISRIKAGREREKEEIGRVRRILSELKDAFDQASLKVKDTHVVQNRGILG